MLYQDVHQWPQVLPTYSQGLDEKNFLLHLRLVLSRNGLHRRSDSGNTIQYFPRRSCLLFRPQFKEDGELDLQSSTFRTILDQLGKQTCFPPESQIHDDSSNVIFFDRHVFHRTDQRCDL